MSAFATESAERQQVNAHKPPNDGTLEVKIHGTFPSGVFSLLPVAVVSVSRADMTIVPIVTRSIEYRLNDALVAIEDLTMGSVPSRDLIAAVTYAVLCHAEGEPCRRVRLSAC
jgi:hypothetical protein